MTYWACLDCLLKRCDHAGGAGHGTAITVMDGAALCRDCAKARDKRTREIGRK